MGDKKTNTTGKRIIPLNIYDLQTNDRTTSCVEKDFALTKSLKCLRYTETVFKLECFFIIICLKGELQLTINDKQATLPPRHMLVCHRNFTLSEIMVSPEHDIRIVGYANSLVSTLLNVEQRTLNSMRYLHNIIPIPLPSPADYVPTEDYTDTILRESLYYNDLLYRRQIIFNLFASLFYKVMHEVTKQSQDFRNDGHCEICREHQSDHIFRRFIEKISEDGGVHRSVSYYSDALCITPKYLSKIIKDISGKTALELINEFAIGRIKEELFHSDKSIKEIASEMNFCNLSFFGKFVKKHLGLSPLHFRKMIKGEKGEEEQPED